MKLAISGYRHLVFKYLIWSYVVVIGLDIVVVLLYYGGVLQTEMGFKVFKKFYVDFEQNIPTFFNTLLLLVASFFLWFIYLLNRAKKISGNHYWLVLFFTFLFLTVDENASAHEIFVTILPRYFGIGGDGFLKFAWVIPYGIFAFLFAIYFIRFLRSIRKNIALGFVVAGCVYISGAIGVEMISSKVVSLRGNENMVYALVATLEETLEMGGLIIFVHFLLSYLNFEFKLIELHVTCGPSIGANGCDENLLKSLERQDDQSPVQHEGTVF